MLDARHTWIMVVGVNRSAVQMVMKHYPPEFRAEAVGFYRSRSGVTIKSVADGLGINHETLRNWVRLGDAQGTGSHCGRERPRPRRRTRTPRCASGSVNWRRSATSCARRRRMVAGLGQDRCGTHRRQTL
ncbi:transposase [Actinosynnema sp. CS-041913]|uniref:transposase n=1 Tax=Actinosynnema sp. CS-041913 TaxID=3239917 RepID=UPI003D8E528E